MGGRRSFGAPAYDREGSVRALKGRIWAVDKVSGTVTIVDERGRQIPGCQVMPTFLSSHGAGMWHMPEQNSTCWVLYPSDGGAPFVMGGCALPVEYDAGDDNEDPNSYRQNRPVLNEGDMMMSSQDGNFIVVRRGGVIEIGSSQAARRFYLPLGNTISDFCENYNLTTAGGSFTWENRYEDERHGADRTPVEAKLQIKEFSEEDPIIDLRLGRIADEDDEYCFASRGSVVARLIINDKFRVWIDRNGNFQQYTHGATLRSHNLNAVDHYNGKLLREVVGNFKALSGSRDEVVSGDDSLVVGGSRTVRVNGNLSETVEGSVSASYGSVEEEVQGALKSTVNGSRDLTTVSNVRDTAAGARTVSTGASSKESVTGQKVVEVSNSEGETSAIYILASQGGEIRLHDAEDDIRLTAGAKTPELAPTEIRLSKNGAVKVTTEKTTVEANSTGVRIKTQGGEITVDALGNVGLGSGSSTAGVVTTQSHPVDYVTGAPILGSSQVSAAGVPSPVAVPPSFVTKF